MKHSCQAEPMNAKTAISRAGGTSQQKPMSTAGTCSWRVFGFALAALVLPAGTVLADSAQTERYYLSGHGPKDAVPWEFSITGGRRAGEWTTIPVPSNWEQQGFGTYNYGQDPVRKPMNTASIACGSPRPQSWKGRRLRLVFDGVMTDAAVKVNGDSAGPVHQGGFTLSLRHHVARKTRRTENLLEVDVAKVSANPDTERGRTRRRLLGVRGHLPAGLARSLRRLQTIDHAAIDARADGSLTADVTLGSLQIARQQGPVPPERIEAQVLDARRRAGRRAVQRQNSHRRHRPAAPGLAARNAALVDG